MGKLLFDHERLEIEFKPGLERGFTPFSATSRSAKVFGAAQPGPKGATHGFGWK
jgi:hypothetical protein